MKRLIERYKGVLAYIFFGVCTTAVNLIVFFICARLIGLNTAWSTILAWFFAVLFAFITNKSLVFGSKSWERSLLLREMASFYLCRLTTGALDLVIMLVTVDVLGWNDMLMKFVSNLLVIVLNYIASKFIIFKKGKEISDGKK